MHQPLKQKPERVATPLTNQPPNYEMWKESLLTVISLEAPAWHPSLCQGVLAPPDYPQDPASIQFKDPVAVKNWELRLKRATDKKSRMDDQLPKACELIWTRSTRVLNFY